MARIHIGSGFARVSVPGIDVLSATARDHYLLNTGYLPDGVVNLSTLAFGSGDSVTLSLPSGAAGANIDLFYGVLDGGGSLDYIVRPDSTILQFVSGQPLAQLYGEWSGSSLIIRRRGYISGQASRAAVALAHIDALGPASGSHPSPRRTWLSASHGLRISKPGFEVTTATDAQLAFDSNRAMLWQWLAGTVTIPENTIWTYSYADAGLPNLTFPAIPYASIRLVDGGRLQIGGTYAELVIDPGGSFMRVAAQMASGRTFFGIDNRYPQEITVDFSLYRGGW